MAMSTGGGSGGPQSDINMTPMIDVLLVLLIIFLVIQPALQKGIKVEVPAVRQAVATERPQQVVLRVAPGPSYFVNDAPVAREEIAGALETALEGMPDRVVFVSGSERLTYGDVMHAIDVARTAQIEMIGLLPRSEMASAPAP
jgi:biopolymer transport protein TolR